MPILVVEDDGDLATTLSVALRRAGYEVEVVGTGQAARSRWGRSPLPSLILLDLMLPDASGTQLCRELRASPITKDVPVLMLTARGEVEDRIMGLEAGADDYLAKPFHNKELLLRIDSILRRSAPAQPKEDGQLMKLGNLFIDPEEHRVERDGSTLALTPLEFRLLVTLLERRGRVQSRDRLLIDVWGYAADVGSRTVDTHVKRLRVKLGPEGDWVETVRGVGYRLRRAEDNHS